MSAPRDASVPDLLIRYLQQLNDAGVYFSPEKIQRWRLLEKRKPSVEIPTVPLEIPAVSFQTFAAPIMEKVPPPVPPLMAEKVIEKTPLPPPITPSFEPLFQTFSALFPEVILHRDPPSDEWARWRSQQWKNPLRDYRVVMISFSDSPAPFFRNLVETIHLWLQPATLIRWKNLMETCRIEYLFEGETLYLLTGSPSQWPQETLQKYYREHPMTGEKFLGERPLLLLEPASEYESHPEKKKQLWMRLCQMWKPPQ